MPAREGWDQSQHNEPDHANMQQGEPIQLKDGRTVYYDRLGYQRSREWVGHRSPLAFSHSNWGSVLR